MKRIVLLALITMAALPAFALDILNPSTTPPVVDGVMANKEYSWVSASNGISLGLALSADRNTLYAAFSAPTVGWVAVGMGALQMNKAWIVMGFDKNGPNISEQTGGNHVHNDAKKKQLKTATVKNNGSGTVLEFAVPASNFIQGGKLDLIMAYGQRADFVSMHRWKTAFSVMIGQ